MLIRRRMSLKRWLPIMAAFSIILYACFSKYGFEDDSFPVQVEEEYIQITTAKAINEKVQEIARKINSKKFVDKNNELEMQAKVAIVMFGCNRTKYLLRSLQQLLLIRQMTRARFNKVYNVSYRFQAQYVQLPIIVSMDCHHYPSLEALDGLLRSKQISKVYDFAEISEYVLSVHKNIPSHLRAYYRLSKNYHLAFKNIFNDYPNIEQLIVVEDDLEYSNDFLEYFISFVEMLKKDESLFCVCAWNDNGKDELLNKHKDSGKLQRTDFFPGLGWMINKSVWREELEANWPAAFWDDWVRGQMKGRTCIQPVVSRSGTFGRKGASNGQFFDKYLRNIHVASSYNPFYSSADKYYSELEIEQFDRTLIDRVYAQSVQVNPFVFAHFAKQKSYAPNTTFRINYYTNHQFRDYSNYFGLMTDLKWGIPRGAYKGIIGFRHLGYLVYLAPPPDRKIYIKSWQ